MSLDCPNILAAEDWDHLRNHLRLSRREAQVAALSLDGLGAKEVAAHLDLSVETVKEYLGRIFSKAAVHSKFDLVLFVVQEVYSRSE